MKRQLTWFSLVFFVCSTVLFAQSVDSTHTTSPRPQQINLRTFVESSRVPLNRPVIFHIELSWLGDLNQYQIEPLEQPILTNLLLEGSGSENRIEPLESGEVRAVKAITYRLKPLEMGMAYIDGIVVKYINQETGEENQLSSQRVMVEIVDPIPEPGAGPWKSLLYIILFAIFFAVVGYFLIIFFKKRRQAEQEPVPVPLPEEYLNRLAQEVDPRGTNLSEMVDKMARIFRSYLDQEFHIRARESSTSEIIEKLRQAEIDEQDLISLHGVLERLDVIRFAHRPVDPSEFSQIYGVIETFLRKRQQIWMDRQAEIKEG